MDFAHPPETQALTDQLEAFMAAEILPRARPWREAGLAGEYPPFIGDLQAKAKAAGLWHLAIPNLPEDAPGTRLTNSQFAPLAEIMGRVMGASKAFNCHPPDVPNMIMLADAATPDQRHEFLDPLLNGETQSAFAMTEPAVASSDAGNIATTIQRDGEEFVISGRKWYISGGKAADVHLVMGITDPDARAGRRQSVIIVPASAPGIRIIRPSTFLGFVEPGAGAYEIAYEDVRVPVANVLGSEGDGFRLGQVRLGPARVHHCMRAIGHCETLIELMLQRAQERHAFGKPIIMNQAIAFKLANMATEIDASRLLIWRAAWLAKNGQFKNGEGSMSKWKASETAVRVTEDAIQILGGYGYTREYPVERWHRDAKIHTIFEGTSEIQQLVISRAISGLRIE